jgi:hypothetical protein
MSHQNWQASGPNREDLRRPAVASPSRTSGAYRPTGAGGHGEGLRRRHQRYATQRAVRGENKTHKRDEIYRAMLRGESTHMRNRAQEVAKELLTGDWRIDPGKATPLKTRKEIDRGWRAVSEILHRQGHPELADCVRRLSSSMGPPLTDREQMAAEVIERAHVARVHRALGSR